MSRSRSRSWNWNRRMLIIIKGCPVRVNIIFAISNWNSHWNKISISFGFCTSLNYSSSWRNFLPANTPFCEYPMCESQLIVDVFDTQPGRKRVHGSVAWHSFLVGPGDNRMLYLYASFSSLRIALTGQEWWNCDGIDKGSAKFDWVGLFRV